MQFWIMLGLTLIILSWLLQLLSIWNKNKEINPWFLFFYSLGVIALIIDGFKINNPDVAFLNIITLIFSVIILAIFLIDKKIVTKKKEIVIKKTKPKVKKKKK